MALHFNFQGLTYVWNGSHTVNVFDGPVEVDVFHIGGFESDDVSYSEFIAGVVRWADYIGEAAYYTSENAF